MEGKGFLKEKVGNYYMRTFKPLKSFKSPSAQVAKVKKEIREKWLNKWKESIRGTHQEEQKVVQNRNGVWTFDRDYHNNYNPFFSVGLGAFFKKSSPLDIHQALKIVASEIGSGTKNCPFRILEDGSGHGVALEELNTVLKKYGMNTIVTATSLKTNPQLEHLKKEGKINSIVTGNAEFFVPTKPVDAIISVAGSLQHNIPMITKNHLLKYAYSLKRGGILLMSFHPGWLYAKGLYSRKQPVKFMNGVLNSLKKKGFEAVIYPNPSEYNAASGRVGSTFAPDMPSHMLILRRISA